MSKMKLNLDDLRVDSFITTPATTPRPFGTVEAYGTIPTPEPTNCNCVCGDSNPTSCTGPVTACGGLTCDGSCESCTAGPTCYTISCGGGPTC